MYSLKIDSFRGYENQEFEFSKYNILIGENSGGKTSLIKLIKLLNQSIHNMYSKDDQLQLNGQLVDVGLFSDFVKNHDETNKIKVTYTTSPVEYSKLALKFFISPQLTKRMKEAEYERLIESYVAKTKSFLHTPVSVTYTFEKKSLHDVTKWVIEFKNEAIGNLKLTIPKLTLNTLSGNKAKLNFTGKDGEKYSLNVQSSLEGFMVLVESSSLKNAIGHLDKCPKLFFEKIVFLLLSQNDFAQKLDSFSYLNPIHYQPERHFLKRDASKHNSVTDYQAAITGLRILMDNPKAKKEFDNAIAYMGLADQVSIGDAETSPVVSLNAKIGGVESNIVDVGYGVSLQVPMLMHLIYMKYRNPNASIVFEQPEIHLHPALQAKFMEALAIYGGKNNSYYIETHSEHMLRKLQVLVKKKIVSKEEVAIYYFKNKNGTFSVSRHEIEDSGFIKPSFPKEFYDTDLELALELM